MAILNAWLINPIPIRKFAKNEVYTQSDVSYLGTDLPGARGPSQQFLIIAKKDFTGFLLVSLNLRIKLVIFVRRIEERNTYRQNPKYQPSQSNWRATAQHRRTEQVVPPFWTYLWLAISFILQMVWVPKFAIIATIADFSTNAAPHRTISPTSMAVMFFAQLLKNER